MPLGTRPQPPVGTARVALSGTTLGHRWVNVFWLRLTDDGTHTVANLDSVANKIAQAWLTDVRAQLGNTSFLTLVKIDWFHTAGQVLSVVHSTGVQGTGGTEIDNAASCIVVDWTIGDLYRGGHPRSYWPSPLVASVSNGSDLTSGYLTALAAGAAAFLAAVNVITETHISVVEMGTVRFQSHDAWLAPPVFRPYTSTHIRPKLGTQRRRILS